MTSLQSITFSDAPLDAQVVLLMHGCAGANGVAGDEPETLADTLEPLFECIVREVAPPSVRLESPLQMLVTNLDCEGNISPVTTVPAANFHQAKTSS